MIASYFEIALRYLSKNKAFSFINIRGLSFGPCMRYADGLVY